MNTTEESLIDQFKKSLYDKLDEEDQAAINRFLEGREFNFADDIEDDLTWLESYFEEDVEIREDDHLPPKELDKVESDKNGVRRKKLYIAFIEWAKAFNSKNTFGSIFDKDAFSTTYEFVPHELRYFYRLANPLLCVLQGNLTFFAVSELRGINEHIMNKNSYLVFAACDKEIRVFDKNDKKIYLATVEHSNVKTIQLLGETFDLYLQKMIGNEDILNAPLEEPSSITT